MVKKINVADLGSLNDAQFHIEAMDIILRQFPEVENLHLKYLMEDEDYKFYPKCIQLERLKAKYPEEIAQAEDLARKKCL
jgi:hypothetical protein